MQFDVVHQFTVGVHQLTVGGWTSSETEFRGQRSHHCSALIISFRHPADLFFSLKTTHITYSKLFLYIYNSMKMSIKDFRSCGRN